MSYVRKDHSSSKYGINNYTYYCIRESDFKEYVLRELKKHSNFHLLEEGVLDFSGSKKKGVLVTKDSKNFVAGSIFQSMITPESAKKENLKYPLVQHFLGIEIKTKAGTFDAETFTIMDVDENNDDGYAFTYTLPYSHDKALIEYTVFSKHVSKKKFYKTKIRDYLKEKYNFENMLYK